MPIMDGYEAIVHLRDIEKSESRERIPMMALSGMALPEEIKKSLDSGFDSHLCKPFKKNDLILRIYELYSKSKKS